MSVFAAPCKEMISPADAKQALTCDSPTGIFPRVHANMRMICENMDTTNISYQLFNLH